MRKIAIYARKSVYREDSISIETQIEHCKYSAKGEECVIYEDNGYSGKDTNRPAFKKLIRDIKSGKICTVIVYKLDRISRSVLDFEQTRQLLEKYNVNFISSTESFDTSTPMGKAMTNISMTFAQLEREQIQQRVTDAYKSRSSKGFYMGGKVPFGYIRKPAVIDDIKTSMFEVEPNEAGIVKLIYKLYSNPSMSLGGVHRELVRQGKGIKTKTGTPWNTARLSEVMRNPAYVKADHNVYNFFKEQGCNICNPIEDFDGEHACYFYSDENKNRKTWDLKGAKLVLAPHTGIIPPDIWLMCRRKILANHQVKTCKPKNSFLSGKVKCGSCGYAMVIRKSQTKAGRYFVCQGRSQYKCCKGEHHTVYATEFENMILERMTEKINGLTIKPEDNRQDEQALKIQELKDKVYNTEQEINSLLNKIVVADETTMKYINRRITELDNKKNSLLMEIDKAENIHSEKEIKVKQLVNVMELWDKLTHEDKVGVVNLLIKKIVVYPENTEITWNL